MRNKLLDTNPLRTVLNLGFLDIYDGAEPATADASVAGNTKLCRISNNKTATGLTFEAAAVGGAITKATAEVWLGTNLATGTATFYRFVTAADDGTLSTTQSRIQGTVGIAGQQLNLTSTSLTISVDQAVNSYAISLPTL